MYLVPCIICAVFLSLLIPTACRLSPIYNLKLIDFGARSSSMTGGTSVIRGDAFLTLLLLESDGFDLIPQGDSMKPEKLYMNIGGSRGSFEYLSKVK